MAAKDFLSAVLVKLAPDQGRRELANLIQDNELGKTLTTLKEYSTQFLALVYKNTLRQGSKALGIFTTLSGRSDELGITPALSLTKYTLNSLELYAYLCRDPKEDKHY